MLAAGLSPNKNPGIGHETKGFFLSSANLSDSKGGQCMGKAGERRERESSKQLLLSTNNGENQYRLHNVRESVPASIAGCHLQAGHCDILRMKPEGGVHGNQQLWDFRLLQPG